MRDSIKKIIESTGLMVCPACEGEGELNYFCGHESTSDCYHCSGRGVIRSLNKEKHSKVCIICNGRSGGCGGCNFDSEGFIRWESFELL